MRRILQQHPRSVKHLFDRPDTISFAVFLPRHRERWRFSRCENPARSAERTPAAVPSPPAEVSSTPSIPSRPLSPGTSSSPPLEERAGLSAIVSTKAEERRPPPSRTRKPHAPAFHWIFPSISAS